jgi:hypothetical protein
MGLPRRPGPPERATKRLRRLLVLLVLAALLVGPLFPMGAALELRERGPARTVTQGARTAPSASAGPVWQSFITPPGSGGLFYPSAASDPADNSVVLFGGCSNVLCPSGDTNATWSYANGVWTRLNLSIAPSPRGEAQMAWDNLDNGVLLFGGDGCLNPPSCTQSGSLNDTWLFSQGQWTPIPTTGAVPATKEGAMAFDPSTSGVILFGGYGCFVRCATWSYQAGVWSELNLSSAPAYRYGEGFAEDDADHGALLFGGVVSASGSYASDTWLFSGGAWREVSSSGPPAQRVDPTMGWDPALDDVVLFGGDYVTLSNFPGVTYSDTWTYHGGTWVQHSGLTPNPGGRSEAAGAEDPGSGVFVMTGGCGPSGCPYGDSWGFGPDQVVHLLANRANCVHEVLSGQTYAPNATAALENGTYSLHATVTCPGFDLANVTVSAAYLATSSGGNATEWNGTVVLDGPGSVTVAVAPVGSVKNPNPKSGPPGGGNGTSSPSGGFSLAADGWILGIVAVAAVGAAAVVLLRRRRPPAPSSPEGDLPSAEAPLDAPSEPPSTG